MSALFQPAKPGQELGKKGGVETFIGPSVKVEGDFSGDGNLVIEGLVIGTLTTKNDLTVGQEAVIEAEVKAQNAHVAGRISGNVTIKGKLELTATAQIMGNVKTSVLSVESGGLINGQLMMANEEHPAPKVEELPRPVEVKHPEIKNHKR